MIPPHFLKSVHVEMNLREGERVVAPDPYSNVSKLPGRHILRIRLGPNSQGLICSPGEASEGA